MVRAPEQARDAIRLRERETVEACDEQFEERFAESFEPVEGYIRILEGRAGALRQRSEVFPLRRRCRPGRGLRRDRRFRVRIGRGCRARLRRELAPVGAEAVGAGRAGELLAQDRRERREAAAREGVRFVQENRTLAAYGGPDRFVISYIAKVVNLH